MKSIKLFFCSFLIGSIANSPPAMSAERTSAALPNRRSESIFPPEKWHNHGSCIVEQTRGGILVCWFHGSGERKADDVRIEASWRPPGASKWGPRFVLADVAGYPDTNPTLFVDPEGKLWLFHPTILANTWESALMKFHVTKTWGAARGPVKWEQSGVLHITPGPEFDREIANALPRLRELATRRGDGWDPSTRREADRYFETLATESTNRLYRRLGWMTRSHPLALARNHWLLPLYHDGFSCSLFAITEDGGKNWRTSAPLIGGGNIQPSPVLRRDGAVVAYMRDNGPPPMRLMQAESRDRGQTWSVVVDSEIPNPGSGSETIRLRDGTWLTVGNDTESGRHSLAVHISNDEGRTWRLAQHLERVEPGRGSYSYPSVIETRDGRLHFTYSCEENQLETIRHTEVNREWLSQSPPAPGGK